MKDFKTTVAGWLIGAPAAIEALINAYNDGYFTGKTGFNLAFGIAVIILGLWAKDRNVSGTNKIQSIVEDDCAVLPDKPLK